MNIWYTSVPNCGHFSNKSFSSLLIDHRICTKVISGHNIKREKTCGLIVVFIWFRWRFIMDSVKDSTRNKCIYKPGWNNFFRKFPDFISLKQIGTYFVYEKSSIDLPLNSLGTSSRRSKNLNFVAGRLPKFFVLWLTSVVLKLQIVRLCAVLTVSGLGLLFMPPKLQDQIKI